MENLASTKDILGEHLHQKVKEVHHDFDGIDESLRTGFINTITGILLEMPVEDIFKMLKDKSILQMNIKMAADSVKAGSVLSLKQDTEASYSGVANGTRELYADEWSQQLYQKVCEMDPDLAPQITGILLEMDRKTIRDMLQDEDMFVRAFEKAKSCVQPHTHSTVERLDVEGNDVPTVIYERAEGLYKGHAPKITGMILELDQARLKQVVGDKRSLDEAISKAYGVLLASGNDHMPS